MTDTATPPGAPTPPPGPTRGPGPAAEGPRGQGTGAWRLGLVIAATAALGILAGFSWLAVVLGIVVMIFLHELGHFLTAKWAGMKVTEFFIGFGPRIWSFRRGETEYGLKAIPAGAYVRIIGMNNLDPVDPGDEARTYRQQSYPKRLLVVSAGSLMHFLQAFVLLVVLLGITGVPGQSVFDVDRAERSWVVGPVSADSAAEAAGLRSGDRIVSIDGERVPTFADVRDVVEPRADQTVPIVVRRDGEQLELTATIGVRQPHGQRPTGFLGIGDDYPDDPEGLLGAFAGASRELYLGITDGALASLGKFVTGGIGDFVEQVRNGGSGDDGPVVGDRRSAGGGGEGTSAPSSDDENRLVSIYGAARLGVDLTDQGITGFLRFFVFLNIFIGVLNLVPLLPLDGGHVAIATYERLRSRRNRRHMADVSRLLPLTYAVFMLLVLVGASALYLDIVDPIRLG